MTNEENEKAEYRIGRKTSWNIYFYRHRKTKHIRTYKINNDTAINMKLSNELE